MSGAPPTRSSSVTGAAEAHRRTRGSSGGSHRGRARTASTSPNIADLAATRDPRRPALSWALSASCATGTVWTASSPPWRRQATAVPIDLVVVGDGPAALRSGTPGRGAGSGRARALHRPAGTRAGPCPRRRIRHRPAATRGGVRLAVEDLRVHGRGTGDRRARSGEHPRDPVATAKPRCCSIRRGRRRCGRPSCASPTMPPCAIDWDRRPRGDRPSRSTPGRATRGAWSSWARQSARRVAPAS